MEEILKYFSEFNDKQLHQFAALKSLYSEWNEKINIISRKDIEYLYLETCAAFFKHCRGV